MGQASRRKELKILMRRSSPDLVDLEFPLYQKYQVHQHKDPPYKVCHTLSRQSALLKSLIFMVFDSAFLQGL